MKKFSKQLRGIKIAIIDTIARTRGDYFCGGDKNGKKEFIGGGRC